MTEEKGNCKLHCWSYILIAMLATKFAAIYGIKYLTTSYEKDEKEKDDNEEHDKSNESDETYNLHIALIYL